MAPGPLTALLHPRLLLGYDRFARLMGATPMYWRLVAQAAILPGSTVLEIGCGTGNVIVRAKTAVPSATVIGLDPDDESLATARRKAAEADLQLQLDQGHAAALPYPDGSVDRVLSSMMLHHVPGDQQVAALREVRRVLAPGGSLHLVDLDTDPRTVGQPARLRRRGPRAHRHEPPTHGHGHGGHGPSIISMLADAGLGAPSVVGHGRTRMGGVTYYRAER